MINNHHFVQKPHADSIKPEPGFCGSGFGFFQGRSLWSVQLGKGNVGFGDKIAGNVSGFIAHLVRAPHRYPEVTGSCPVEVLNIFQVSFRNCINCVHMYNCEDQCPFDFQSLLSLQCL